MPVCIARPAAACGPGGGRGSPDDAPTQAVIGEWADRLPVTKVPVQQVGVVAAMNAGWAVADGDVVALTDDDSAPHADWLAKIASCFDSNPGVGAVGGRDLIGGAVAQPGTRDVGRLTWWGRMIGGHHQGEGEARSVDFLKGVNMAIRRCATPRPPFDTALRGRGAQVHWEIDVCLALQLSGWSLVYDPQILVDHYPAQRHDSDQRVGFHADAEFDRVHNETMVLMRHLPSVRRAVYRCYMALVGTRENVGLVQAVRLFLKGDTHAAARLVAGQAGRAEGRRSAIAHPVGCVAVPPVSGTAEPLKPRDDGRGPVGASIHALGVEAS